MAARINRTADRLPAGWVARAQDPATKRKRTDSKKQSFASPPRREAILSLRMRVFSAHGMRERWIGDDALWWKADELRIAQPAARRLHPGGFQRSARWSLCDRAVLVS